MLGYFLVSVHEIILFEDQMKIIRHYQFLKKIYRIYSISLRVENTGEIEIIHQEKPCCNKMKDEYSVTLNP